MSDVRYDREGEVFERRCELCLEWWPLTLDFWNPRWMTRCRACVLAWRRDYQNAKYRDDPEFRETRKASSRLGFWKRMQNDPASLKTRKAIYEEGRAERRRELARINYWANRDRILEQRRQRREKAA